MSKEDRLNAKFGWIGIRCTCGEMFRYPPDAGFSLDPKFEAPMQIFTIECTGCKKLINIKIEIWSCEIE